MAAVMLGAAAGVTVRETIRTRNEGYWLPVRPGSAGGADARGGLPLCASPLLGPAPPRAAELLREGQVRRGDRAAFSNGFEHAGDDRSGPAHYLIQPAPWHSGPNPDPDQRMAEIVEGPRLNFKSARAASNTSTSS